MTTKQQWTAETIKCFPISTSYLGWYMTQQLQTTGKLDKDTVVKPHSMALVVQPKLAMIDEEFCGWDIKGPIEIGLYTESTPDAHTHTFSICPEFKVTFNLDSIREFLMPEVTLAEYAKDRRGYNGRIRGNEENWMRHFNGEDDDD